MEKTQSASISIIDRFAGVDDPRMERARKRQARRYYQEIDRSGQTQRMGCARVGAQLVAALREPPAAAFGVSASRMSARRDVQEAGRNARRKQAGRARGRNGAT